jgi:hypothetical protein
MATLAVVKLGEGFRGTLDYFCNLSINLTFPQQNSLLQKSKGIDDKMNDNKHQLVKIYMFF